MVSGKKKINFAAGIYVRVVILNFIFLEIIQTMMLNTKSTFSVFLQFPVKNANFAAGIHIRVVILNFVFVEINLEIM